MCVYARVSVKLASGCLKFERDERENVGGNNEKVRTVSENEGMWMWAMDDDDDVWDPRGSGIPYCWMIALTRNTS
jgi:hypothetical protein